jgi:hypothetical protein
MKPTAPCKTTSVNLPTIPPSAYLFLVRRTLRSWRRLLPSSAGADLIELRKSDFELPSQREEGTLIHILANRQTLAGVAALTLIPGALHGQDAKFAADNLKYSRDFYAKTHFVAVAESPDAFKYDRYPLEGPERIQCADGTYLRQHGKLWRHVPDKMRTGIPITYMEFNRYVMTFAGREEWGRFGQLVDEKTTQKLSGWIKLVDAAFNVETSSLKLVKKSELGRAEWIFQAPSGNPNGILTQLTFRKLARDKSENVLLHEFSGSMRLEGDHVVPADSNNAVKMGFGYMMRADERYEVSEFVWEEMQQPDVETKK